MKQAIIIAHVFLSFIITGCGSKNDEVKHVTDKENSIDTHADYQVTFIELGSVSCIPCKMMKPIVAQVEKEYAGRVKVVFLDVWTADGKVKAAPYKIRVIPTQVFLDKDGNEYYRHEGFFPKEELVKVLEMKLPE